MKLQFPKKLQFLDPRNRFNSVTADALDLAAQFMSYSEDDIDSLTMEHLDYRSCTDDKLPNFNSHSDAAIDHFWADVGDLRTVIDLETLRFGKLAKHSWCFHIPMLTPIDSLVW